jgi:ABC-type multidrug transport system fused ATPase/permease subunit
LNCIWENKLTIVQLLYRRSSREVKRLEGVSRSPIFAHLSGSLNGLATIRAYGVEGAFEEANREKVDVNNSPQMYFEVLARWLALRLDLVSTIVVTVTSLLVVGLRENIPASLSALALSYAVQTTGMLQWGST